MAITDQLKKVKNINLGNINLNDITSNISLGKDNHSKALDAKIQERAQIYNYIGMEAASLHEAGKLNVPDLDMYFDKLATLKQEIEELEIEKQKMELQTKGRSTCSCGAAITVNDRFCPVCGKTIDSGFITCICGTKVKSDQKFCPVCGNSIHDMNASMIPMGMSQLGMMSQQGMMPQQGMMLQQGMMPQQGMIPQVMPIHASELRMKKCICGAKVPEGQTMCMECGRKIQ